jgi:hypothetical protein
LPKITKPKNKEEKHEKISVVLKEISSTKIPLKPIPNKNSSNKSSFGWIIDKD